MSNRPKKYSFALNPDPDYKVSKCPQCHKSTFKRKFPLVIHVDNAKNLLNLGFTCKYCAKCEFIVADKYDLQTELTIAFEKLDPACIGNEYMVIGTSDKRLWNKQMQQNRTTSIENFQIIEFESVYSLQSDG
ncbi:hypothetical protein [Psychromonas sp.]|uniref:hypothetical protein n=1 Tax=Psychromonas sp. TaxID=1884585 RepID=UPI0035613AAD